MICGLAELYEEIVLHCASQNKQHVSQSKYDISIAVIKGIETEKNDTAWYRASELPERSTISIAQQKNWRYPTGPIVNLPPFHSEASSYKYK
jgi:hypothetical protein